MASLRAAAWHCLSFSEVFPINHQLGGSANDAKASLASLQLWSVAAHQKPWTWSLWYEAELKRFGVWITACVLAQQTGWCTCYLLRPGDPDNTTGRGEGGFVSERGWTSRGVKKTWARQRWDQWCRGNISARCTPIASHTHICPNSEIDSGKLCRGTCVTGEAGVPLRTDPLCPALTTSLNCKKLILMLKLHWH